MSSRPRVTRPAPIPVHLVSEGEWDGFSRTLAPSARTYLAATGYRPHAGRIAVLPAPDGNIDAIILGTGAETGLRETPFLLGRLATDLPAGRYALAAAPDDPDIAWLGFLLGGYRFATYKPDEGKPVELDPPRGCPAAATREIARAVKAGRNLINMPANDLTTTALARAAAKLARRHGARLREIRGDALLKANLPLIHAVGRASAHPPRLVDFTWGDPKAPRVTLVGKGVVFDTGGLNIKPDNSMLLMRKDMGGAAAAMTAADILMSLGVNIRLRVLLPIVENAISGPAFRPGDIYRSRKGPSVEIGNTDAEGRLILADALALADEEKPELLVDFATLTGAARVALGPDLPPFFTDDDTLAAEIAAIGGAINDPVWRLPLWPPYRSMLDSKFAEINNVGSGGFAGAITAALFLRRFVTQTQSYAHFDIFGWVPAAKPGRPEGGEPQAARLVARLIQKRYGRV